ncbi:MAG: squalene/phytoene synthase family protein, partial [Rhodospirillaceae bacterium]|nr:squalene/phytoene synthase family protein [Rhodospirillaceae bacterium]
MTKSAHDENFPVATWFVAPRLRPAIRAYYAFARAADDIADDPTLGVAEKLARLDAFSVPPDLARELAAHDVPTSTATDLL